MQYNKKTTKNKIETTQKAGDSEIMIHQKMQLWTNEQTNEYALKLAISSNDDNNRSLENSFLARTNPNSRYVHLVAESDYLEDLKHGWDFTLRHFIEEYKNGIKQQQHNIRRNKDIPRIKGADPTTSYKIVVEDQTSNDIMIVNLKRYGGNHYYPIKLIPHIKCHYCDLHFHNENERKEHELELHV